MKSQSAFLGIALTAAMTAGCSGGSPGSVSSFLPNAAAGASISANGPAACKKVIACRAKLMIPLTMDGTRLSVGSRRSCRNVSLSSAKSFTAPRTRHFTLKYSITLPPSCARFAGTKTKLFIAVAEVGKSRHSTRLTPLAGPVSPQSRPWTFTPVSTGVAMAAKARYAFFIVAVPADETTPTPSSGAGTFRLLSPMSFDGTSFAQTGKCSNNVQDAPVYTASADGALTLSTVAVAPTCAPDGDRASQQLYIVAVPAVSSNSGDGNARRLRPSQDGSVAAVAVAGPVNATDATWSFAPDAPGLTVQAGSGYAFFIAAMIPTAPATPSPPQSYRGIVPLDFDGTGFTAAPITSCGSFNAPAPYAAPETAPLTLAGPITIVPTCSPSSGGNGDEQSAQHLFVVASLATFESDSIARVRPSHDGGAGVSIDGIAIAGPVLSTDGAWSFSPLSPALTLTQGLLYRFYVAVPDGENS